MKIVVAMDSFKSCLSATDACKIIKDALQSIYPDFEVISIPMADGGEGTAQAMMAARGGKWLERQVTGPLPEMQVKAGFAFFPDTKTALVEMSKASGLELLTPKQANPLKTTTFGTGQLIRGAADYGADRILLAVGGSATVDGGVGAAQALGWKFLDSEGEQIGLGGGQLEHIAKIIRPDGLDLPELEVLCDVNNPLIGPNGAARVFGPQKGAAPEMVEQLDAGLKHLAEVVKQQLGKQIAQIPGGGAAGGLSAGAFAFMDARLVSGIETIIRETGLTEEIKDADWVITGEGRFDSQSLRGKVVSGVAKAARQDRAKVVVIAGRVALPEQEWRDFGITEAIGLSNETTNLADAIANVRSLLAKAVKNLATEFFDYGF
ncbi:MAG: glycerate kinase [Sedimentisphaerales bacterium]|nr:glycerate kinase [Sedimentisphaerales bacterium]